MFVREVSFEKENTRFHLSSISQLLKHRQQELRNTEFYDSTVIQQSEVAEEQSGVCFRGNMYMW